ncbi:MAG: hypothetical protein HXX16_11890 [Bacteroidales bacterium]|nr:hypothetical protein [Bacteroidales bacterium]
MDSKVENSFLYCMKVKSIDSLVRIKNELEKNRNLIDKSVYSYWQSYTCYITSLALLVQHKDKDLVPFVNEGLSLLNDTKKKTSEHLVLMSQLLGLSAINGSLMEVNVIAAKSKAYGEKSIMLDTNNLRAYLGLAMLDFYSPSILRKETTMESLLLKAISMEDRHIDNPILPKWGKSYAYYYLIEYYRNRKEYEKCWTHLDIALKKFPNDVRINMLKDKLKNL